MICCVMSAAYWRKTARWPMRFVPDAADREKWPKERQMVQFATTATKKSTLSHAGSVGNRKQLLPEMITARPSATTVTKNTTNVRVTCAMKLDKFVRVRKTDSHCVLLVIV